MITYKSFADLNNCIFKNIGKFPTDIDLVVGVPRSGMLPANLLALYMNKPYTDLDSFVDGRIYTGGFRTTYIREGKTNKVLIIDDSISSGSALRKTKEKLAHVTGYEIIYAAVYARSSSKHLVNVFCEIVDGDRIFQWNMFHHKKYLMESCVDIDGVLCTDPTIEENDDGEKYKNFLLNAKPKFLPTVKIKTLISCRLEKWRKETCLWLKTHNIEYENLILLNLPNRDARIKWGKYGEYKAAEYRKAQYKFFIESSLNEAKTIKQITGKPVFCIETMGLV